MDRRPLDGSTLAGESLWGEGCSSLTPPSVGPLRLCMQVGNPRRDIKPEPYGPEAKEFLRQRLVGAKVKVALDYSRKLQVLSADGSDPTNRGMDFGSVTLLDEKPNDLGQQPNIGEMLVLRGMATVVRHRADEERAANYEALVQAEAKALKNMVNF